MKIAIRYYSRKKNTRLIAEAIADAVAGRAVSITDEDAPIKEETDILFIGGALYAYGIDKHLKQYIEELDPTLIKKAVVFSTSWISTHVVELITEALLVRGITVQVAALYVRSDGITKRMGDVRRFALRSLRNTAVQTPEEFEAEGTPAEKDVEEDDAEDKVQAESIYELTVKDNQGQEVSLSQYAGKVLLIVNTATRCGFTPQYTGLEELYKTYHEKGFEILDFPCNQFAFQAPGNDEKIDSFCKLKYDTTFPRFAKIKVNGKDTDPLYVYLKSRIPGRIMWNFTKFLIDKEGNVAFRFTPGEKPETLSGVIEDLLAQ